MSYHKFIALILYFVSFALSAAHVENPEQMLKDTAATAISEYKGSKDVSAISRIIPQLSALQAEGGGVTLVTVSARLLNALYETVDRGFNPRQSPVRNSEVPGGQYRAGTAPESIKEPQIRAEYEKVLSRDRKYAEHYSEQLAISDVINDLARLLRAKLQPMTVDELERSLQKSGMKVSYTHDFRERLRDQAK